MTRTLESGSDEDLARTTASYSALDAEAVNAAHSAALHWTSPSSPTHDVAAGVTPDRKTTCLSGW